jgi:hypothetical protein
MGHFILWLAERPVVATGFGSYLDAKGFAESQESQLWDEDQLIAWMDQRRLGYIVAGAATYLQRVAALDGSPVLVPLPEGVEAGEQGWLAETNLVFLRDRPVGSMVVGGSGVPALGLPHLSRLRPVFASSGTVGNSAVPIPVLWVYQRVEPLRLQGRASPGDEVFAGILLDVHGTEWPWAAGTTADAEGNWHLDVPILPGSQSGGVRAADAFEVQVGSAAPLRMQPSPPPERAP